MARGRDQPGHRPVALQDRVGGKGGAMYQPLDSRGRGHLLEPFDHRSGRIAGGGWDLVIGLAPVAPSSDDVRERSADVDAHDHASVPLGLRATPLSRFELSEPSCSHEWETLRLRHGPGRRFPPRLPGI